MRRTTLLVFGILLVVGSATTFTDDGGSRRVSVRMSGYNETPLALSTTGNGRFQARISRDESEIQWELSFGDLEGTVTQSHIHFGSSAQTGGVSIFLCSNLGNGPAGTQACPASAPDDNPVTGVATAANVKSVIGFYGVYDMQAQWLHDQITRPRDQISEKFLGASPMQNRRIYFDASPTSYATVEKNEKTRTRFLLIHGTNDDIVDPQTQSQVFLTALKQAGFFARSIVVPGSGHFWASEPVEEPGSYGAQAAPQMLRFLQGAL